MTPAKPASFSEAAGTRESFCFAVLALAELLGAAGLAKANLLTFDFASIASDETGVRKNTLEAFIVVDQGAGDTVTDSASLTRFTAADDVDHNVKRFDIFGELQRLHDDHAARFTLEVLVERTAIDNDLARAALNEDASDGALATAGAVIVVADHLCHTLLEVKNLGLLSRMRMFGAGVDLELLDHCVAEGALRKHALDGDFESASRMLFLHLSNRRFDDAAGVAGVTIVRLPLKHTFRRMAPTADSVRRLTGERGAIAAAQNKNRIGRRGFPEPPRT